MNDDDFDITQTRLEITCPVCTAEIVHNPDSLALAESPRGAVIECGECGEITQWKYSLDTLSVEQVIPVQYGGSV